jgi:ribose transport system permease protein
MFSAARGMALIISGGLPVTDLPSGFSWLGAGQIFTVPVPAIIAAVVFVTCAYIMKKTRFGRYVYAIGGNEEATRLSGVDVRFHKTAVYVLSGAMSALAAVLLTARLNSAQPIAGMMYELDAIAATVIGGTSLMGGSGTVGGTLIGALIMGVLRNGLNLLGISSFLQQVVIGLVIVAAVLIDSLLKNPER